MKVQTKIQTAIFVGYVSVHVACAMVYFSIPFIGRSKDCIIIELLLTSAGIKARQSVFKSFFFKSAVQIYQCSISNLDPRQAFK